MKLILLYLHLISIKHNISNLEIENLLGTRWEEAPDGMRISLQYQLVFQVKTWLL